MKTVTATEHNYYTDMFEQKFYVEFKEERRIYTDTAEQAEKLMKDIGKLNHKYNCEFIPIFPDLPEYVPTD